MPPKLPKLPTALHDDLEMSVHGMIEGSQENSADDNEPVRAFWPDVAIACIEFIEMIDQGQMSDVFAALALEEDLWKEPWRLMLSDPSFRLKWTEQMRGSLKIIAISAIEPW
jgi:hypothetical protein